MAGAAAVARDQARLEGPDGHRAAESLAVSSPAFQQLSELLACQGFWSDPDQGSQHRLAAHAMGMVQLLLLQGEPLHHSPLLTTANAEAVAKAPGAQVFAAGCAAQAHHISPQPTGTWLQADSLLLLQQSPGKHHGFLRQPFQIGSGFNLGLQADLGPAPLRLHPGAAAAAIDLLRRHAGKEAAAAGGGMQANLELIPAYQSASGVQQRHHAAAIAGCEMTQQLQR